MALSYNAAHVHIIVRRIVAVYIHAHLLLRVYLIAFIPEGAAVKEVHPSVRCGVAATDRDGVTPVHRPGCILADSGDFRFKHFSGSQQPTGFPLTAALYEPEGSAHPREHESHKHEEGNQPAVGVQVAHLLRIAFFVIHGYPLARMHGRGGNIERRCISLPAYGISHNGCAQRFAGYSAHSEDNGIHRFGLLPESVVADANDDADGEQNDAYRDEYAANTRMNVLSFRLPLANAFSLSGYIMNRVLSE